jgi:aspartate/methionine/tyrosine aminotransferase
MNLPGVLTSGNVPINMPLADLAALLKNSKDEWLEAGGVDLWKDSPRPDLCATLAARVANNVTPCNGSPMRAQLGTINDALAADIHVIRASVGNADHKMHPVLAMLNSGHAMHYNPFRGKDVARDAFAALYRHMNWAPGLQGSDTIITGGTADGIQKLFLGLTVGKNEPNILVITDDDNGIWPNIVDMVRIAKGRLTTLSINASDDDMEHAVHAADVVYVLYPAIFGEKITREFANKLVVRLKRYAKPLVVDGVYNGYEDPQDFYSWMELYPEGAIMVGSISKEFAAGKLHIGMFACYNQLLIQALEPFLQATLCVPDLVTQEYILPATLLTAGHYLGEVREIYNGRVRQVQDWCADLVRFGATIIPTPAGIYVPLELPFVSAAAFSKWFTGSFSAPMEIDDEVVECTGVGTEMTLFYPANPELGKLRFRISCVLPDDKMQIFCRLLCMAVEAYGKAFPKQIRAECREAQGWNQEAAA